jgi:hypothetical protein
LPAELIDFVARNDGAEPETNVFKIGPANESGVNGFIPIKEIVNKMPRIENLPPRSFPVAWAEGGNYVFVNLAADGAVFFWITKGLTVLSGWRAVSARSWSCGAI